MLRKLKNGSDIRGIAIEKLNNSQNINKIELTNDVVSSICKAFAVWLSRKSGLNYKDMTVAVGHDSRLSAMRIKNVIINTLRDVGVNIYDCSLASTPAMFMAVSNLQCTASIEITASHLPSDKNGLKFFTCDGGLNPENIDEILSIAEEKLDILCNSVGSVRTINLMGYYSEKLRNLIKQEINSQKNYDTPLKNLKIVVDAGNGAGGFFAKDVLEPLGADITGSIGLEPDGNFPIHVPNPEDPDAMKTVTQTTLNYQADLGIIFDTDVDRVAVVDATGEQLAQSKFVALVSAIVLKKSPGSIIVTDSVTSESLKNFINSLGGHQFRYKRGYNNVINMAKKINNKNNFCPLAIETSGHAAFRENNFVDDGAYLACKIIIQLVLLKNQNKTVQNLISNYKKPVNEINLRLKINTDKINNIEQILSDFEILAKSSKNINLDTENIEGTRVHFSAKHQNGWVLLRKSLHEPMLIIYAESYVTGGLKSILDFMKQFLKKYVFLDISNI